MSLEGFLIFAGSIAAIMWLAVGFGRLTDRWHGAQGRIKILRRQQVAAAKELLKNAEEIARIKAEEKDARTKLTVVQSQAEAKKKEVAEFVAPTAPEIVVTSEYPPAKGDKAWTITLVRTAKSRSKPDTALLPAHKQYLVWGADQKAALGRARQLLSQEEDYEVSGGSRYS